ncbi:MAG: GNAT family N-acetyltransferase [Candidatus Binatia bacterium]
MEIRIRRGRRTDYDALSTLGAWPEVAESPARSIRMFRRVVADLAYDLYVAEEGTTPVGLIAVSYVRALALGGQRATLEQLVVAPERRGAGIGTRLLEFVLRRAAKRGARMFEAKPADEAAARFLDRAGFRSNGTCYARLVSEGPG